MGLKVSGLEALIGDINDLSTRLSDSDRDAILEMAAKPILDAARAGTKGKIAAAIKTRVRNGKASVGVHRGDWHEKDYYPVYVEYGHGGPHPAPPHPYLRPAADAHGDEAMEIIKSELQERLK